MLKLKLNLKLKLVHEIKTKLVWKDLSHCRMYSNKIRDL